MPDSGKFKDLYLNSALTYPCQGGLPAAWLAAPPSQGLLARRCLSGRRSVGGGFVLIIHWVVGRCSQSGQALKLLSG